MIRSNIINFYYLYFYLLHLLYLYFYYNKTNVCTNSVRTERSIFEFRLTNNRVTIMWYTILIDNFNRYDKFIVFWIEMDRSFSMFLFSKILLTDPSIPILGCRCYNGRNNIAETVSRIYTLHARNGIAGCRKGFQDRFLLEKEKRRNPFCVLSYYIACRFVSRILRFPVLLQSNYSISNEKFILILYLFFSLSRNRILATDW